MFSQGVVRLDDVLLLHKCNIWMAVQNLEEAENEKESIGAIVQALLLMRFSASRAIRMVIQAPANERRRTCMRSHLHKGSGQRQKERVNVGAVPACSN